MHRHVVCALFLMFVMVGVGCGTEITTDQSSSALKHVRTPFEQLEAHPPFHIAALPASSGPTGLTPFLMRKAYNLPESGGNGTIAIVDAFDAPNAEADLSVFNAQFGLPECTTDNGCFEKHLFDPNTMPNANWSFEVALDTQWAHAVAPNAKILLVLAKTSSYDDMMSAIDYARMRPDVVAVSMSWGGIEMPSETDYDDHFTTDHGVVFFAASGDGGTGVIWPSASPGVVSVGGTSVSIKYDGTFLKEAAWAFSGGGVSRYEPMPSYQVNYGLMNKLRMKGDDSFSPQSSDTETVPTGVSPKPMRITPDVSMHANTYPGYSVYYSYTGTPGWLQIGGTSGATPCWAAIHALGLSATNENFYKVAHTTEYRNVFRDITAGWNGKCGARCTATTGYDYVTGLGTPLAVDFSSP